MIDSVGQKKIDLEFVYLIFYKPLLLLQRKAISKKKKPSYTTNVFLCLAPGVGSSRSCSGSYKIEAKCYLPLFHGKKENLLVLKG